MRGRTLAASAAALALAIGFGGCTRKETPSTTSAPVDAAVPDAAVAIVDAAAPRFGEGGHDYRGTVSKTAVSMHLEKLGLKVSGAYAYDQVGKPIGLDGTLGEDGTIALDEFVGDRFGKVTGHLTLHPEGRNLVGTWSDAARKKTLPLTLEPSPPTPALYVDAGAAPGPSRQADQCLADLACSAEDAERLYLRADDERDPLFECARFLEGAGVKKDLARGRACFERTAGKLKCDGGSPDASMGQLAALRIDGVGGPRDIAGARKMLASCFEDVTVQALRERADLVEKTPGTPAVDFCKDIGGTTLVGNDCTGMASEFARDRSNLLAKKIAAALDDKGRALFRTASRAHADYVFREAALILWQYAGGSLRFIVSAARTKDLETERAKDLADFATFTAANVGADELAGERTAQEKACQDTTPAIKATDDPEMIEQLKSTEAAFVDDQKAWAAYRDAEVAFYTHVFGKKQDAGRVRDTILLRLMTRRTKACTPDEH